MVGIFAGLYGIAFIFTLFLLLRILKMTVYQPAFTSLLLFFYTLCTFLFRCIYLSIYVSGGLREEGPSSYVLVELPSFFILSVASILIMSYGFCVFSIRNSVPLSTVKRKFWFWWFLFRVFLYSILVIVLTLLCTLNASSQIHSQCFGRIINTQDNFVVQTIRIAYHSFLLILAVISTMALFLLERELHSTSQSDYLSHLSIISGISVLSTSVLWVVYSALSGSSPYFVIPLWCCEALPLMIICLLVGPSFSSTQSDDSFEHFYSWTMQSKNSVLY
jgi:hypothetical protein